MSLCSAIVSISTHSCFARVFISSRLEIIHTMAHDDSRWWRAKTNTKQQENIHTQHSEMLLYVKFSTTDFLSFARIALLYLLLCLRKSLFAKQIFTKYYRREPHTDDSIHHVPICMCAKWEKNTHFCALYSRYGSKRRVYTRATGQCMQEYVWFGEKKWKKK